MISAIGGQSVGVDVDGSEIGFKSNKNIKIWKWKWKWKWLIYFHLLDF
jgi:hypothetical protein